MDCGTVKVDVVLMILLIKCKVKLIIEKEVLYVFISWLIKDVRDKIRWKINTSIVNRSKCSCFNTSRKGQFLFEIRNIICAKKKNFHVVCLYFLITLSQMFNIFSYFWRSWSSSLRKRNCIWRMIRISFDKSWKTWEKNWQQN